MMTFILGFVAGAATVWSFKPIIKPVLKKVVAVVKGWFGK